MHGNGCGFDRKLRDLDFGDVRKFTDAGLENRHIHGLRNPLQAESGPERPKQASDVMNAFGFTDSSGRAIVLDDVLLKLSPEAMWELARFVVHAATEMERLGDDFDHLRFRDFSAGWQDGWPDIQLARAWRH